MSQASGPSQRVYNLWAPVYDLVFGALMGRGRRRAIALLDLQPGERLFVPGIGTGLDLPNLPPGIEVTGVEINPAMLAKARKKAHGASVALIRGDAQRTGLPDGSFDAALFNLILSVVPDGAAAFREGWRLLRAGGRAAIFDKFLPEQASLTRGRRLIGWFAARVGTDVNRRLADVLAEARDVHITHDEPDLFGGQYRVFRLEKRAE
ncbi:MAG: methyltransferase domain-containing protein [Anaerolineae bacterium]|nr:methyltransferase domain-containing protein [Anaerolineae bacterium]